MTHHNRLASLLNEMGLSQKRGRGDRQPHEYERRYVYDEFNGRPVRECLTFDRGCGDVGTVVEFMFGPEGEYVSHGVWSI